MRHLLSTLKQEGIISELNYQFALLIDRQSSHLSLSPEQKNLALFLAAFLSFHVMQGHSCLNLRSRLARQPFGLTEHHRHRDYYHAIQQKIGGIAPLDWQTALAAHPACSMQPSHVAPLLFQHERLYFYRYWQAEYHIAQALTQAAALSVTASDYVLEKAILTRFFPSSAVQDWQKIAVATALHKSFCLISGGPGTGKTRTVAILLAALQLKQAEQHKPPLHIALAAPTGKAAARLKESIASNLDGLALPESLKQQIPTQASTLHTLLGIRPNQDRPHYHAQNPLLLDLLVVDEASMIDLFVMEKLFNALKPTTRVILLGDKDQLAAVEAGNAMSELGELLTLGYSEAHCRYLAETTDSAIFPQYAELPPICDSLCHLRHSYRFDEHSGIGKLANYINLQHAGESWQMFQPSAFQDLMLYGYPPIEQFADASQRAAHCVKLVVTQAVAHYRAYLNLVKQRVADPGSISVEAIFSAFQQVRFLSALRVGELGVERLNQVIADALQQARLVEFKHARDSYLGKPVLITENAAAQSIFSGDIGIVLPNEQGQLRVYFETRHEGKLLNISPSRLPSYEAAYVMTVHKSQGSEFEHTLLIMPLTFSPVLSKELLYTAVTRAKKQFTLFSDEKIWHSAVKTEIQRQSGLKAQLFAAMSPEGVR